MSAMEDALAQIDALHAAEARDAARQVTVTVDFITSLGDELTVTITGIAPFAAAPARRLTTVPAWTVRGQPSQARQPSKAVLRNGPPCLRGEVWGGLPLFTKADAERLASMLNAQIRKAA